MIKYCLDKWNTNKEKLQNALEIQTGWNECNYKDLVIATVEYILNGSDMYNDIQWDAKNITEIDNGDYQGTLIFLIPQDAYQPAEYEYLITYVYYGSCSGCDTLLAIQDYGDEKLTNSQVKAFMSLCKDIVMNMKKPYNCGWRNEEIFNEVSEESKQ